MLLFMQGSRCEAGEEPKLDFLRKVVSCMVFDVDAGERNWKRSRYSLKLYFLVFGSCASLCVDLVLKAQVDVFSLTY